MSPKVRPTFTIAELRLLGKGMEELIAKHIKAGDFNNPILLTMYTLKQYCEDFQAPTAKQSDSEKLAAYIAQQTSGAAAIIPGTAIIQDTNAAYASPVTNPELTEDQIFDLLNLRDSTQRTEDENIWMLNVGTMIMLRRAGNKPVNTTDL